MATLAAAALADGVVDDAVMLTQHAAVHMDDLARFGRIGAQLADDLGIIAVGHEADVLAVRLVGDGQAEFGCKLTHLRLGHAAKRKADEIELVLRGGEQEIALVTVKIGRAEKRALVALLGGADIVAGCQCIGAKILRGLQEIGELDRLVAGDAGDRGFAGDVAVGETVHDLFLEPAFIIQHVVGMPMVSAARRAS